jgi:nicotinamidase-related amidase
MTEPKFYDPKLAGKMYPPDIQAATKEAATTKVPPAEADERRVLLLLVDPQVDFIHSDGSLSVPGAVEDTRRTVEWLYKNMGNVTTIAASLDSHIPLQIFFPTWWTDSENEHPDPYTPITPADVEDGLWQPLFEEDWSRKYVHQLKEQAKKELMIWPFHTMIGTPGHTITPALYEAIAYHAAVRRSQPEFVIKGTIAKTEYYSLLEPELKVPEDPRGTLNEEFLERLLSFDSVYIAGQAKSHCVLETVNSIMRRYGDNPEITGKLHLLEDCTSSVQHPEIDFEAIAQEAFEAFEKHGLKMVTSKDPIEKGRTRPS